MRRTLSRDLVLALLILIGPVPMVAAPMGDALAQERTSKGAAPGAAFGLCSVQ